MHGPEERANGDTGGSEDVDDRPRRGRQDHGVQLLGQVREEVDQDHGEEALGCVHQVELDHLPN